MSGTGPSFSLRNSEKCGIWVGWAVYLIRTASSSCSCFWSYIPRHALRSSLRDWGLFRLLLQASGKTYYKLVASLSRKASVSKEKSSFENVMVSATWIRPVVQSLVSPMAANQKCPKDHAPDGMLSAAEKRKPSTKWLDQSRSAEARLLHSWVIRKHDGIVSTQVLPIFPVCHPWVNSPHGQQHGFSSSGSFIYPFNKYLPH